MRQGEIDKGRAWFGFTPEQLFWLLERVPTRDGFYDEISEAIKKFEAPSATWSNRQRSDDEPRRYCPNCRASITDTDVEVGECTQCHRNL